MSLSSKLVFQFFVRDIRDLKQTNENDTKIVRKELMSKILTSKILKSANKSKKGLGNKANKIILFPSFS